MKKYIIIGGCSYAYKDPGKYLLPLRISENGHELDYDDVEFLMLGASSASNEFITEAIIIAVSSLLENGVLPKDILVINNFTQIGRTSVKLPIEYYEIANDILKFDNFDIREYTYSPIQFTQSLVKVKNQIYSFLISDRNLKGSIKDWYDYQSSIIYTKKTIQEHFESYLSSIVTLQSFVKKNNIKTISFLMNNVFDGWDSDYNHIYNNHKEFNLPSTKGTKHISEISDYTKALWDCIDLDMFVFHTTNENKYGGIDEYLLDKFPDKKYFLDPSIKNFYFGNHPTGKIYYEFAKEYMINQINDWFK